MKGYDESIDLNDDLTGSIVVLDGQECEIIEDRGETVLVICNGLETEVNKTELGEVSDVAVITVDAPVRVGSLIIEPGDEITVKSESYIKRLTKMKEDAKRSSRISRRSRR